MPKAIGVNIRELRKKLGLTLEEVGKKLGVSRATVQRYESGVISEIPCDKIKKMAEIFNVSPSYIIGWDADSKIISTTNNNKVDISDKSDGPSLNPQEEALLVAFHLLNADGKDKVLSYISDLIEMPKYTSFTDE